VSAPTKVKICGITQLADARYCAGAGVDYLGFIQYPDSPRYVEPKAAKEIIDWIEGVEAVGVFVNEDAETINARCREAGFTVAQLHGHEPPEVVEAVEVPVIKSFRVQHDASSEQLRALMLPYKDVAEFVLLDTHKTSLWGGTGESFNWRLARELAGEFPLFLAGGISAENVQEAIDTMRPYAVDLSSSVESAPGVKDFDKLYDFFEAYRAAVEAE
jgi:phosphoribosylanthranilate isomerase